jgi:hypothetical protein
MTWTDIRTLKVNRHSLGWRLRDTERKALARKRRPWGKLLALVITVVWPETLHEWLCMAKMASGRQGQAEVGL